MYRGYSDTGKQSIADKLRYAIHECLEVHGSVPVAIKMNPDDRGEMRDIDGIPLEVDGFGGLVANRNMFWFQLPTVVEQTT